MKKMFYFLFCLLTVLTFSSCSDDDDDAYKVYPIQIQLAYPENAGVEPSADVTVSLKNTASGTEFTAATDAAGLAKFEVPEGLYEASATDKRVVSSKVLLFNGLSSNVAVNGMSSTFKLNLEVSMGGSIVIKELYVGGCPKDDGSGRFGMDQYVVLYNNSSETLDLSNFAFAMVNPFNATGSNKDYVDGKLFYAADKVIPAGVAVWYFDSNVKLEGGKELVVAINGAVNHTTTYSQSVDLSNSEYYCFYDPEDFNKETYYPSPSEMINPSHYLKAYKYGLGTAWPLSQISPAFFIFSPEGTELEAFVKDPATTNNYGGNANMGRKMVPEAWIVDGIEVFKEGADNNMKRLTPSVDAGYVNMTNGLGYSLYRNVDKEATEALEANKGKLVYNYALGVGQTTDPSGIDAEASLKNGARIIYMDTNNSTNDFHQRSKASLRN